MMKKEDIQKILNLSLDQGADFAELFFENTYSDSLQVIGEEVVSASNNNIFGVGIRLLQGSDEVYGYTNKIDYHNVLSLVLKLKNSFKGGKTPVIPLKESQPLTNVIKKPFNSMTKKEKAQKLLKLSQIILNYDSKIIQSIVTLSQKEQHVLITNSLGVYQKDQRNYIKCNLSAVASSGKEMQEAFEGPGRFMGLEFFDHLDLEQIALNVAINAVTLLQAQPIKPQTMPVVINNAFGGVIFHEACGHSLEATAIAKGLSPFNNKLNQKVASEIVTAWDDGNIENAWGRLNFDDEGRKTQKNLLIEKGILKGYLVDFRNGRKMKMEPTGSSRRQSYKYSPTSRMNSTYIEQGEETPEQIIADTPYGLYAKSLGGGTVRPSTGEFNFVVNEGYLIENGKLTVHVKGAMLIGKGQDVLYKIDRVANDLVLGQGVCGSDSGSLPVDVGQPTIRVKEMIVGGHETK
ncbi:TldD/PmbA family protein ['Fragaria x ananassa' phyllody phytoplasma]|uniref:TldD/PmbA family protein n=1 Tax='Fragaria x ananassa' phyllody phytoplasma TaxID=2358428 RepID=A0ABS5K451_9MOLU|nr:TldD/PmbA family protein ['Fragaria x ananassa' phyllody phytoplasma]MBS2126614.1 TldD/PmbA family protein ['Fragaria x ananassa' phyllody phytoplasma]